MALINITPIQDGTTAQASQVNTPLQTIVDEFNGNITSVNLANGVVTTNKLGDGAVTPGKRSGGFYMAIISFSSGSGTKTLTGFGFRPKYVRFISRRTASATIHGEGVAYFNGTSIVQYGKSIAANTSAHNTAQDTSNCLLGTQTGGGTDYRGSITSFDEDGVTINIANDNSNWRDWLVEAYA